MLWTKKAENPGHESDGNKITTLLRPSGTNERRRGEKIVQKNST